MKAKLINNSTKSNIYDTTLMLTNDYGKILFVDIQFDRKANARLGCDATQFENDLITMLKFVTNDNIQIE